MKKIYINTVGMKSNLIFFITFMLFAAPASEKISLDKKMELRNQISQLLKNQDSAKSVRDMGIDKMVVLCKEALVSDINSEKKERLITVLCESQLPHSLIVDNDRLIENETVVELIVSAYQKEQVPRSDLLHYLLLTKKESFPDSFEEFLIAHYQKDPEDYIHALILGTCGGREALHVLSEKQKSGNRRVVFLAKTASARIGDEQAEEELIKEFTGIWQKGNEEFNYPKDKRNFERLSFALTYVNTPQAWLAKFDAIKSPIPSKVFAPQGGRAQLPWQRARANMEKFLPKIEINVPRFLFQKKATEWWAANRERVKRKLESINQEVGLPRPRIGRYINLRWGNAE